MGLSLSNDFSITSNASLTFLYSRSTIFLDKVWDCSAVAFEDLT